MYSPILEDGTPIKGYIHANRQPVTQIDYDAGTNHERIQYVYTDHLVTPRLATDQNRVVTWRWEGDAFGETLAQSLGAVINLRFPRQYFDQESELHFNSQQRPERSPASQYPRPETGESIMLNRPPNRILWHNPSPRETELSTTDEKTYPYSTPSAPGGIARSFL
ncbi:MAG: hypothetical protein L0Y38_01680 [Methylococcaceae bacterium]|nr:hypothetical protein [Methylococcaceae bacterium]